MAVAVDLREVGSSTLEGLSALLSLAANGFSARSLTLENLASQLSVKCPEGTSNGNLSVLQISIHRVLGALAEASGSTNTSFAAHLELPNLAASLLTLFQPSLSSLSLMFSSKSTSFSPSLVPHITACRKLRSLRLRRRMLPNRLLAQLLLSLPHLTALHLEAWANEDEDLYLEPLDSVVLQSVGTLTSLTELRITDSAFPNVCYTHLTALSSLRLLALKRCQFAPRLENEVEECLRPLLCLTALTSLLLLPVGHNITLPPSFLGQLTALRDLASLTLVAYMEEQFVEISNLTSLTELSFYPEGYHNGIPASEVLPIWQLPQLRRLDARLLSYSSGLGVVSRLVELTSLGICAQPHRSFSFEDAGRLGQLSGLQSLELYGPDFEDAAFGRLCMLLTGLTYLYLESTNVADRDLPWFTLLPRLKKVEFVECPETSEEAAQALLERHPSLETYTFWQ